MNNSTAFSTPSGAQADELARLLREGEAFDHLGRRRIIHPDSAGQENPKYVSMTRATTFIKGIDDETGLHKWRARLAVEGAREANLESNAFAAMNRLLKATEGVDDPKLLEAAEKEYRGELDEIWGNAFSLAGGYEKADYGTALHGLADKLHTGEITLDDVYMEEERWPGIAADFQAYENVFLDFVDSTGAKVLHTEVLMVNDDLKVAGRTDLVLLAKLPGDQRARRVILDIKTGSIDNGRQLSQQLDLYSSSKFYNPQTGVREASRIRRDVGIIAHVPRGEKRAELYLVELAPGRRANRLCLSIREARRKVPGIMTKLAVSSAS